MKSSNLIALFASAACILAASAAQVAAAGPAAQALRAGQAYTVNLADRSAVVYFTTGADGFQVISTAADDADGGNALRVVHTLKDGESIALQLSSEGAGSRLVLTRAGDMLNVGQPIAVATN